MFRTIWLMKRKPGMSPQAFRDYYETTHRLIGEKSAIGHAVSYERFYLYPMNPGDPEPIYDVVMQLCFPDRAVFDHCLTLSFGDPETTRIVVEDEEKLFDRTATVMFAAEDSCSKLLPLPPGETMFRTIWFARHREGMSHAECRDYYEAKHRLLGEYIMNGYAHDYDRHYLHPLMPGAAEPYYSFVMEMNFASRDRFDAMAATIGSDPALSQLLAEDEARYIDRDSAVHYRAERCASALPPVTVTAA